jgi:hypothetical protein
MELPWSIEKKLLLLFNRKQMEKEPLKQQRLHCWVAASGKVNAEVAVDALVLAVQALMGNGLLFFFASVNGWGNCDFNQVFSSDDG